MFKKLATAALLTVASLSFTTPAAADPIVDGCWGAVLTFCDPELRVTVLTIGSEQYPVCAGTCRYVPVPDPGPGPDDSNICLDYTTASGNSHSDCVAPEGYEGIFSIYCAAPYSDSICRF